MKFISLFLALLCFLVSCSESPQLSQESIVGVWSFQQMNKKKQMGIIKFFSDATGEANADGKVEHFKWYFDTSRKLSEWYDNRAIKPTSLSIELGTNISYVMYEITEDGILTFGIDQYPQNHILSHKDIFLGKRLATKEAPH